MDMYTTDYEKQKAISFIPKSSINNYVINKKEKGIGNIMLELETYKKSIDNCYLHPYSEVYKRNLLFSGN